MISTTPDFEKQPATKQDIADVRTDLSNLETKVNVMQEDLTKVKSGVEHIEELLTRPPEGLIPRVKRVEEEVGIRPGT